MASTSGSNSLSEDGLHIVDQFCAITGCDKEKAIKMLEVCSWNLEMAVNMHVDSDYQNCDSRLNNESAKNGFDESDNVRPPIPPSRATLVEDSYSAHYGLRGRRRRAHSIFDGFRDFQAEARWQELSVGADVESTESFKKRKTLEDLFRPPLDLMHRGSFESARELGQSTNRWLMVNIQDSQEFACQVLNRDVWSNQAVKSIVSEHFVFWQVYCESAEGQRYIQFYNPVTFPYVSIIDPRTGENLIVWNKIDSVSFCDMVMIFLSEHSTLDGQLRSSKAKKELSLLDVSEEQQFKAAVEASLKEVAVGNNDEDESDLETFDSDSESQGSKPSKLNCTEQTSDIVVDDNSNEKNSKENENQQKWEDLLGSDTDPMSNLVLRLPDGQRKQITWPCTTQVLALLLYMETLGYKQEEYEIITNFPKKNICQLPLNNTLKDVGLFPRETIFVQLKHL